MNTLKNLGIHSILHKKYGTTPVKWYTFISIGFHSRMYRFSYKRNFKEKIENSLWRNILCNDSTEYNEWHWDYNCKTKLYKYTVYKIHFKNRCPNTKFWYIIPLPFKTLLILKGSTILVYLTVIWKLALVYFWELKIHIA